MAVLARRPASAKATAVRRSFSEGGSAGGAKAAEPRDEPFVRQHAAGMSALGERAAQFVGVPTWSAEYDDLHGVSDVEETEMTEATVYKRRNRATETSREEECRVDGR